MDTIAVDYLLKPIGIERLKEAVQKAQHKLKLERQLQGATTTKIVEKTSHFIVVERGIQHVIRFEDIIALEAQESYTSFHLKDRKILASKNLRHFEQTLEDNEAFFRSHKSWIIQLSCVENYSKSKLEISLKNGMMVKLSKYKKAEFEALIHKFQFHTE